MLAHLSANVVSLRKRLENGQAATRRNGLREVIRLFSGAIAVGGEVGSGVRCVDRCLAGLKRHIIFHRRALWRIFAIRKHIVVGQVHRSKVCHVEMPVDFLETTILVAEVTAFAVGAELFTIELTAVLRLVLIVGAHHLLVKVHSVALAKFLLPVGVLAFGTIAAEPSLGPVLTHFALIVGALNKAFVGVVMRHKVTLLAVLQMCWIGVRNFDWRHSSEVVSLLLQRRWNKTMRLLHVQGSEWVQFGLGWHEGLVLLLLRLRLLAAKACHLDGRRDKGHHSCVSATKLLLMGLRRLVLGRHKSLVVLRLAAILLRRSLLRLSVGRLMFRRGCPWSLYLLVIGVLLGLSLSLEGRGASLHDSEISFN